MNYRISDSARRDLDDMWAYIAGDDLAAADRLVDSIINSLVLLTRYPEAGRTAGEYGEGLRRHIVGMYVIFYRVFPTHLEVLRVLHSARDIEHEMGGDRS